MKIYIVNHNIENLYMMLHIIVNNFAFKSFILLVENNARNFILLIKKLSICIFPIT